MFCTSLQYYSAPTCCKLLVIAYICVVLCEVGSVDSWSSGSLQVKEEEEEQIQSDKEQAERLQKEEDTVMVSACIDNIYGACIHDLLLKSTLIASSVQ